MNVGRIGSSDVGVLFPSSPEYAVSPQMWSGSKSSSRFSPSLLSLWFVVDKESVVCLSCVREQGIGKHSAELFSLLAATLLGHRWSISNTVSTCLGDLTRRDLTLLRAIKDVRSLNWKMRPMSTGLICTRTCHTFRLETGNLSLTPHYFS